MGEREALLRAVCENPDDDLPRLVLADWLEEHGEAERAEFIRCDVELAREFRGRQVCMGWMESAGIDRHAWLTLRLRVLSSRMHRHWEKELPQPPSHEWWSWGRWERGFANELELRSSATLARRPDLLWASPVTRLRIRQVERADDLILSVPQKRLRHLSLDRITDEVVYELLDWLGREERLVVKVEVTQSALLVSTRRRLVYRLGPRLERGDFDTNGPPFVIS